MSDTHRIAAVSMTLQNLIAKSATKQMNTTLSFQSLNTISMIVEELMVRAGLLMEHEEADIGHILELDKTFTVNGTFMSLPLFTQKYLCHVYPAEEVIVTEITQRVLSKNWHTTKVRVGKTNNTVQIKRASGYYVTKRE